MRKAPSIPAATIPSITPHCASGTARNRVRRPFPGLEKEILFTFQSETYFALPASRLESGYRSDGDFTPEWESETPVFPSQQFYHHQGRFSFTSGPSSGLTAPVSGHEGSPKKNGGSYVSQINHPSAANEARFIALSGRNLHQSKHELAVKTYVPQKRGHWAVENRAPTVPNEMSL